MQDYTVQIRMSGSVDDIEQLVYDQMQGDLDENGLQMVSVIVMGDPKGRAV